MRYWSFALLGLVLTGAALVSLDWGVYHAIHIGTCGSGGPYVYARVCPSGTGKYFVALFGGTFAMIVGLVLWSARGASDRPSPLGLGTVVWMLGFLTGAASVILAAYGPAATGAPGTHEAAIIIGVIFIPMGLAPAVMARSAGRHAERVRDLTAHGRTCPGEVTDVQDTNITVNNQPRIKVTVQAQPSGGEPFTLTKSFVASRIAFPRRGDACTILYDPADPQRHHEISFDGGRANRGATVTIARVPPPAADGDGDAAGRIERLAELRDKGLVTADEFEAQKRRLLAEL